MVPRLDNEEFIKANGICDPEYPSNALYSTFGFERAWYDWQGQMINKVNELTAERPLFGKDPRSVLLATARDPMNAALFNHASMALNNHLYFNGISSRGPTTVPQKLADKLSSDFDSLDNLKNEMLAMAHSMFGPGFVWLVRTDLKGSTQSQYPMRKFMLLTTYLAGSPLAGAHNRQQPLDMNTQNVAAAQAAGGLQGLTEQERLRQTQVQNSIGAMGSYAAEKGEKTSFGGIHIVPCLCVNTWQHAWIYDFGLDGKMAFLERWWNFINWEQVNSLSGVENDREPGIGGAYAHRSQFVRS